MTKGNKLLSISMIFIIILLFSAAIWLYCAYSTSAQTGSSYILIEASSGRILRSDNKDMRLEEASTTKVMTALVTLENADLDRIVTVPDEAVGIEGSSIYLKYDEKISVRTLLYGLMLRSGNDAAQCLAVTVGGSEEKFVEMMNDKAAELGLENTHFVNAHGLHAEGHYTSAYDLAMITREAFLNDEFVKIVSSKSYKSGDPSESEAHVFYNKNKLLTTFDGANGVKTGYTTSSGKCFVGAARRDGMQLISVALNRGDMWEISKSLLQYGFDNYEVVRLARSDEPYVLFETGGETVELRLAENASYPVAKGSETEIEYRFEPLEEYPDGIAAGETVGNILFFENKRLIFTEKVVTVNTIKNKRAIDSLRGFTDEGVISDWKGLTNISPLAASRRGEAPTS